MTGLMFFVSVLFLLQSLTNIVLILFIKKWIGVSKQSKVNLDNIFEGFANEHIQSKDR